MLYFSLAREDSKCSFHLLKNVCIYYTYLFTKNKKTLKFPTPPAASAHFIFNLEMGLNKNIIRNENNRRKKN